MAETKGDYKELHDQELHDDLAHVAGSDVSLSGYLAAARSLAYDPKAAQMTLSATMQSLVVKIFVTTIMFFAGISCCYPILPRYALELQLSGAWLGTALAGRCLGSMLSNAVSGWVVSNWGVRWSQVLSCVVALAGGALLWVSTGFCTMTLGLALMGFGWSLHMVGRMAYFRQEVPTEYRGRVISLMGGCYRLGAAIGPVIGGWSAEGGDLRRPFLLSIPMFLVCGVLCATTFETKPQVIAESGAKGATEPVQPKPTPTYGQTLKNHMGTLAKAGPAMFFLEMLRGARDLLIPLFGQHLGLSAQEVGLAITASYLADTSLFPVAGIIYDKYGRKVSGIPAFAILASGMLAMTYADDFTSLLCISVMTGCGNGLCAGLFMTTGTDLAPPPPEASVFLGIYSIFADGGGFTAPLLIGVVSNGIHVDRAGLMMACIGYVGLTWYACLVPETRRVKT